MELLLWYRVCVTPRLCSDLGHLSQEIIMYVRTFQSLRPEPSDPQALLLRESTCIETHMPRECTAL